MKIQLRGYKQCYQCKQTKTIDEFNKNKTTTDGLHSYCRKCQLKNNKDKGSVLLHHKTLNNTKYIMIDDFDDFWEKLK